MQKLQPPAVRKQSQRKTHMSADLSTSTFVFVRHDAIKRPLQPPYDGPYKVLQRTNKNYTLDILGKKKVVSLDRLKPAYIDNSSFPTKDVTQTSAAQTSTSILPTPICTTTITPTTTTRTTRSGRHVHWPKRLAEYTAFT